MATERAAKLLSFDAVEALVARRLDDLTLIAIDGAPLSGKSTLADRLAKRFQLATLGLDGFFAGPNTWAEGTPPTYPFVYFRYDEFEVAVKALRETGSCGYRRYRWVLGAISETPTVITRHGAAIVEGCSVLDPRFAPLFDLRLFVEGDLATLAEAQQTRDGDADVENWRNFYLPSVERYLATDPASHADYRVAGRGR